MAIIIYRNTNNVEILWEELVEYILKNGLGVSSNFSYTLAYRH